MRSLAGLFTIMRDSANQAMLRALSSGSASRDDLTRQLGVSSRVVSNRLRRLSDAKLIVIKELQGETLIQLHSSVCVQESQSATEFKFTSIEGSSLVIRIERP